VKILKFIIRNKVSKVSVYALFIFIQEDHPVLNLPGLSRLILHIGVPSFQILSIKKQLPAFLLFFCCKCVLLGEQA
jgi:hypothetical protein